MEISVFHPAEIVWAAVVVATLALLILVALSRKSREVSRGTALGLGVALVICPPVGIPAALVVLAASHWSETTRD